MWKLVNNWLQKCIFMGNPVGNFQNMQVICRKCCGKFCGKFCGKCCRKFCGKSCGKWLGNDAVFSLNTWLRTIYCLQTIHKPACVILTLFQFFYLVPNSKIHCTVVSCIWQRNYLFSFFNAQKGVSFSQSFRNTRMSILRILYVYENLECTRKLDDFSSSQLTISYHVFCEQLILWIVGIIVIHYYFLI